MYEHNFFKLPQLRICHPNIQQCAAWPINSSPYTRTKYQNHNSNNGATKEQSNNANENQVLAIKGKNSHLYKQLHITQRAEGRKTTIFTYLTKQFRSQGPFQATSTDERMRPLATSDQNYTKHIILLTAAT